MKYRAQWLDGQRQVEAVADDINADRADVVVLGGGTAGVMAALAVLEAGCTVIVIEKLKTLGGILSHTMFKYYMGNPGGRYEAHDHLIRDQTGRVAIVPTYGDQNIIRSLANDHVIRTMGGTIIYGACLTAAYANEEGQLTGVEYLANGQRKVVEGAQFIDCTGDASLARLAGVPVRRGRESDGRTQPFSHPRFQLDRMQHRVIVNNIDAGYVDERDVDDYSSAVLESAQNAAYLTRSAYADTVAWSPILGVREGVTIIGQATLSLKKLIINEREKNPLFYTFANVDNHTKDIALESQAVCDWMVALGLWAVKVYVPVPLAALRPKNWRNILVAGRHISVDHDLAAQARMMRDCQKSGEAAGLVAALAVNQGVDVDQVDYAEIQTWLTASGCLPDKPPVEFVDNPPDDTRTSMHYPSTLAGIREALCSNRPGLGILAAYRAHDRPQILAWLNAPEEDLRFNAAIVLALWDDPAGTAELMVHFQHRDPFVPRSSRSYNSPRGVTALYLLGRLGSVQAIQAIEGLLTDYQMLLQDEFEADPKFLTRSVDYQFQYVTHALRALLTIAAHHRTQRDEVVAFIRQFITQPKLRLAVTLKYDTGAPKDMTVAVRHYVETKLNQLQEDRVNQDGQK
ncbi:FAD-dependent oxidoreductase [Lacticaseibacillus absianus]|uniref:FAD-dependent oxidoreductase n=1 Tax=Lacticaseibacillus absianus TaxID=2729623 RepID=UPI0015C724DF|nr:FAD-dependent oxidoreductase [Lacticaseibacillus absianus]